MVTRCWPSRRMMGEDNSSGPASRQRPGPWHREHALPARPTRYATRRVSASSSRAGTRSLRPQEDRPSSLTRTVPAASSNARRAAASRTTPASAWAASASPSTSADRLTARRELTPTARWPTNWSASIGRVGAARRAGAARGAELPRSREAIGWPRARSRAVGTAKVSHRAASKTWNGGSGTCSGRLAIGRSTDRREGSRGLSAPPRTGGQTRVALDQPHA